MAEVARTGGRGERMAAQSLPRLALWDLVRAERRWARAATGRGESRAHLDTLRDRVEAVDGTVTAHIDQTGTVVELEVPARGPAGSSRPMRVAAPAWAKAEVTGLAVGAHAAGGDAQ